MATAKKTTAKSAEAKKTTATPAKTAAKAPAKKTTAAKKPAAKKAETKVEIFIEYAGATVPVEEVVKNVKLANGKDAKNLAIYIKPDESKAYYVADGDEKEIDVYFVG